MTAAYHSVIKEVAARGTTTVDEALGIPPFPPHRAYEWQIIENGDFFWIRWFAAPPRPIGPLKTAF